jgi:hypothetical protein
MASFEQSLGLITLAPYIVKAMALIGAESVAHGSAKQLTKLGCSRPAFTRARTR